MALAVIGIHFLKAKMTTTDLPLQPRSRRRRRTAIAGAAAATALGLAGSALFFSGENTTQDVLSRRSLSVPTGHRSSKKTGASPGNVKTEQAEQKINALGVSKEPDLLDGMNINHLWMFGRPRRSQQSLSMSPEGRHNNGRRATTANDLPPAFHSNVSYGPYPENTLDIWIPKSSAQATTSSSGWPVVMYIHGGGWRAGDKHTLLSRDVLQPFLDAGIAFASIDYRLTRDLTYDLQAPNQDAARALQYIKYHAADYDLDSSRVALSGFSAGGATAMWLMYHSDLADPDSDDPIERVSTKVQAGAVFCGQTSIDPREIEPWIGPSVSQHLMILNAVGETSYDAMMKNYDAQHAAVFSEYSPINHVLSAAKSDGGAPPLFMVYEKWWRLPCHAQGECIHHGMFGAKMKERCDEAAVECHLVIQETPQRSLFYNSPAEFLVAKLGVHKKLSGITAGVAKY